MKIKGLKAIVTGGAMGIGLATVKRLLAEGVLVTIWDIKEHAIKAAEEELSDYPHALFSHQCDVTDKKKVYKLVQTAIEEMGGVDILINNAGIMNQGLFHEIADEEHVKTFEVNIISLIYTIKAVLPFMIQQNSGFIINISSAAGILGVANLASYASTKWAVWGLTESLRHEIKNQHKNIHFSSIHPGYLKKGLFAGAEIKGLGRFIVPRVKSYDVIAKAIVKSAIKGKKTIVFRPRSIRAAVFFRGILPDILLFWFLRMMNVHTSMDSWKGRNND